MVLLKKEIEAYEKETIMTALKECGWVQSAAARQIGISERTMRYKIKKYGIEKGGVSTSEKQQ
ncbi:MAG: hypothetical protein ISR96_03580 [Nitrospira sp.]|nr:hypothetical protein [bacterium]MBL7048596.1 hypothetical protein [Nitrospira sp.]